MIYRSWILVVIILFVSVAGVGQVKEAAGRKTNEGLGRTWKGPGSSLIATVLKRSQARSSSVKGPAASSATPGATVDAVKFKPAGNSGVARSLAEAFGSNPEEKATLTAAFQQIRDGFEAELAKEGKSNDLAAAMALFIVANVTTFHQSAAPSDEASEQLYESLRATMNDTPAFAGMTNAQKHQMSDWLVCMSGFVVTAYEDAKKNADKDGIANVRQLADYSMRLVLGVEVGTMNFAGGTLLLDENSTASSAEASKIVGVWSNSGSGPAAIPGTIAATQAMMVHQGSFRSRYTFKANGSYEFKSERSGGYYRSEEWWTTDEIGTYSVSGDSVTVSPKSSKMTLRNSSGVVQKTNSNPLEKVTYKWRLEYMEGIQENYLILQAAKETMRDVRFTSNTAYPNSFLYTSRNNLEFRY